MDEAEELLGWLEDVEAAQGAFVLASFAERPPTGQLPDAEATCGEPAMRGGFVASLDATEPS